MSIRGLRIHQVRSGNCSDGTQRQHTEDSSDETEEVIRQDSNHTTGNISAGVFLQSDVLVLNEGEEVRETEAATSRKARVNWLKMLERKWKTYEDDLK